jgi:hypothetical protein
MSLVRLLSTGKSLVGGATKDTSRYRMGNPGMLPKFGSAGKTLPSGKKELAPVVCESETIDQSSQPQERIEVRPSPPKETFLLRAIYRGWISRFKARLSRIYVKPARPAAPRSPKPAAVQTELSLDKVRVVRNDLSETDLEIVRGKASSGRSHSTLTQVAPEVVPGAASGKQAGEQVVNR